MSPTSTAGPVATNLSSALTLGNSKALQTSTQSASAFFAAVALSIAVFGIEVAAFLIIKGYFPRI